MNYLSYDEQFAKNIPCEDIARIESPELRSIRNKYLQLRREAFLDEQQKIVESDLSKVFDQLMSREMDEIDDFKKRNSLE